jgi:hypothetical protein
MTCNAELFCCTRIKYLHISGTVHEAINYPELVNLADMLFISKFYFWMKLNKSMKYTVTCRPISRQHPKYAHATTEKGLQE